MFLLRPPNLLRRRPFLERENVCNSQETGVRARYAAIVNHPAVLKILRVVNLLRVLFLVRRGPLGISLILRLFAPVCVCSRFARDYMRFGSLYREPEIVMCKSLEPRMSTKCRKNVRKNVQKLLFGQFLPIWSMLLLGDPVQRVPITSLKSAFVCVCTRLRAFVCVFCKHPLLVRPLP